MLTNCYVLVKHPQELGYRVLRADSIGNLRYSITHRWRTDMHITLSTILPSDQYEHIADLGYYANIVFSFINYDDLVSTHPEYLL